MMYMPCDVLCKIFKFLPMKDQYNTAADIFEENNEAMEEFVQRKEYIDNTVSAIYNDIGFDWGITVSPEIFCNTLFCRTKYFGTSYNRKFQLPEISF